MQKKRIINVKYCLRGKPPKPGTSAIIPWSDDYQRTLDSSKKGLKRYLPALSEDWKWFLATPDPDDPTFLAEISPEAFVAVIELDQV
ncbi:hypothetical protein FRC10_005684, partial [Ceratobasidium sp. 414]